MPRVRADDYDTKVRSIMDAAAELFSTTGYPGAKMQDIAKACGASKSMLYHYFPAKDDLLFAMLKEHLEGITAALEAVGRESNKDLKGFTETFIQRSAQSRRRNMVAMNDVKYLPEDMQAILQKMQSNILDIAVKHLHAINPELPDKSYKSYALLLMGMLNWTDTWYKPNGALKPEDLVERISRLFLHGFMDER